jgi:hypothetical protein
MPPLIALHATLAQAPRPHLGRRDGRRLGCVVLDLPSRSRLQRGSSGAATCARTRGFMVGTLLGLLGAGLGALAPGRALSPF